MSLVIGNFSKGLSTTLEPFVIDNESFPVLINAYTWRGRVRKKRGTQFLGRLRRDLTDESLGSTDGNGDFSGNIISILSLETNASIVSGNVSINVDGGGEIFTEPSPVDGTLVGSVSGTGTINYETGDITLDTDPNLATAPILITFSYYPSLPVLGLEDLDTPTITLPELVAFDTKYSYEWNIGTEEFFDVTFFKASNAPFVWTGSDFQQFWSTNYQNSMWVTNGVIGHNFKDIVTTTIGSPTSFNVLAHGMQTGDFVFINEIAGGVDPTDSSIRINGQSGSIIRIDDDNFTLAFDSTGFSATAGGVIQVMTRSGTGDGIKWYDGDPTGGTNGWVNFTPPLDNRGFEGVGIPDYLVGADLIVPFKDRLLFIGPTYFRGRSTLIKFSNRVIYSQNGTPYYAEPVPTNETFQQDAWFQNVAAKGGFIGATTQEQAITAENKGDVLIIAFEYSERKLISTGNDSLPFIFQTINSEIGASSTFSGISLDSGVITIGDYGFAITNQTSTQRIDLQILDSVFNISSFEQNIRRVTAFRDFRNEFIYFTYVPKNRSLNDTQNFPKETLVYNYRDNNWATFKESYTHYGNFRESTGYTWATLPFDTWAEWTNPWNFGNSGTKFPFVCAGNQQGYVVLRDVGAITNKSRYVQAIEPGVNTNKIKITSPEHNLDDDDFIEIKGILDTAGNLSLLNGVVQKVSFSADGNFVADGDKDFFYIEGLVDDDGNEVPLSGTYLGLGEYRVIDNFDIRTKQFNVAWDEQRKSTITSQMYLLDKTTEGEITVSVFVDLSTDIDSNRKDLSPYLAFENILFTRFEGGDLINKENQDQIFHRVGNAFNGDTIQIGFSLSDAQIRDQAIERSDMTLHGILFKMKPGPLLA